MEGAAAVSAVDGSGGELVLLEGSVLKPRRSRVRAISQTVERWYLVLPGVLICYKSESARKSGKRPSQIALLYGYSVDLEECKVVLKHPTRRTIQLLCGDEVCAQTWLSTLRTAVAADAPEGFKSDSSRTRFGVCSWCISTTFHGRLHRRLFRRDVYRCGLCQQLTQHCQTAFCLDMARMGLSQCVRHYQEPIKVQHNLQAEVRADFVLQTRGKASFPERAGTLLRPLIDGREFFKAASGALRLATKSIFISMWIIHARIRLTREPGRNGIRLDELLKSRAEEGVRIYICLYWEPAGLMDNESKANADVLSQLHPNISVVRHPTQPHKWSHHQKFIVIDDCIAFVGGMDLAPGRYDFSDHLLFNPEGVEFWWGADYYNPHVGHPTAASLTDVDDDSLVPPDPTKHLRMPWHDVDVCVVGAAALDVACNFRERWSHHSHGKAPAIPDPVDSHKELDLATESWESWLNREAHEGSLPPLRVQAQVVRSICSWSGCSRIEASVYSSYMEAIESAEHYVYIENQYVSSATAGGVAQNGIIDAIIRRVHAAVKAKRAFRVFIIFPQPEEVDRNGVPIMQASYNTLSRGGSSLLERLEHELRVDPQQYISICQLRSCQVRNGYCWTEQVFVHSKLLIVDDKVAVVASANLNDRSMLGDRDSELGVKFWGGPSSPCVMGGETFSASKAVRQFRIRLWSEHLGLLHLSDQALESKIGDATCAKTYEGLWCRTAASNSRLYEHAYRNRIANDNIRLRADWLIAQQEPPCIEATDEGAEQLLSNVQGLLTKHPLGFLADEFDTIREALVPDLFN